MNDPATGPFLIDHNVEAARFEARVDGWLCRCDYRLIDGVMHLVHTEVAPALEGRGIAARLVQAALDHARLQGLKVLPRCSYVRVYMRRHPETQSLMA
jgi:predicted GNAT family acetyltransferase